MKSFPAKTPFGTSSAIYDIRRSFVKGDVVEVQNLFCVVAEAAGERRGLDEGTGRHFFNEFINGFSIAYEGVKGANKTGDDKEVMQQNPILSDPRVYSFLFC